MSRGATAALLLAVLAASVGLAQVSGALPDAWRTGPPPGLDLDMAGWVSAFMNWLVNDARIGPVSFIDVTRGISWLIDQPYRLARAALRTRIVMLTAYDDDSIERAATELGVHAFLSKGAGAAALCAAIEDAAAAARHAGD